MQLRNDMTGDASAKGVIAAMEALHWMIEEVDLAFFDMYLTIDHFY